MLAAALPLYDVVCRRPLRWRTYVLAAAPLACYPAVRTWVLRSGLPAAPLSPVDNPLVEAGFLEGRWTALGVIGRQLWQLVWPAQLSADYSYDAVPLAGWPPQALDDWQPALAAVVLLVLAAALWRLWRARRWPAVVFFASFALVALLPTANLVVIVGSIRADRFLYLPLAGFAGAVAVAVQAAGGASWYRRPGLAAVVGLALAACAVRTAARNLDWRDESALWSRTVETVPRSAKAHRALAQARFVADPSGSGLDAAIAGAEQAVTIRPDFAPALVDLGGYYLAAGDRVAPRGPDGAPAPGPASRAWYDRAAAVLERARMLDVAEERWFVAAMQARGWPADRVPVYGSRPLYEALSLVELRRERLDAALDAYRRLRDLDPWNPLRYQDVSAVLFRLGRWEDGAVALQQALVVAPRAETAARLAGVYRLFAPGSGAVAATPAGMLMVVPDAPLVREHRCRALRELADAHARANEPEAAARAREGAAGVCPAG